MMSPKMGAILSLTLILLFSCTSDGQLVNPFGPEAEDIDLLTGLSFRDVNGQNVGQVGNPNTKMPRIIFYPNPANNSIFISSNQNVEKIWFLRGEKKTSFMEANFAAILEETTYSTNDLESKSELTVSNIKNNTSISTSLLSFSYYRIFFLFEDGSIEWDNLYIDRVNDFSTSIDELMNEWN